MSSLVRGRIQGEIPQGRILILPGKSTTPQEVFWHLNSLDQEGFNRILRHLLQPQELFMERQHLTKHLREPKPVKVPKRTLARVETSLEMLKARLDGALSDMV